ncbi:MAG: methylated-DNA--[protein]-cysteine S-methyltransferase [Rikenellaceae bacterium]
MPTYKSPLGYIKIEHKNCKLTLLKILKSTPSDCGITDEFTDKVFAQLLKYFRGELKNFDVEVDTSACTPFQESVLKELQKIPYGETRTYKDIAIALGKPTAARAVGGANNKNPIHIIIPCHRVIGGKGKLVGYAAGLDTKETLLDIETSKF